MAADQDPAEKDDHLGRTVGKYNLVRLLGVGGMGRVYEGVHTTLGKRFALKFIDRESATGDAVQRFQREAQAASAVDSAHIVDIFDVGTTDDGIPYIVMELLRGEDLGHRIRRLGRLDLTEALRVIAHVLRGLARAHDAGIVHRDLKPDNIFLVERDDDPCFAKILDFGVSKIQRRDSSTKTITREGTVLGTPVYMSPEQAQALPDVDARTDLWAIGAILYECLAGSPPHSGATYEAVIVGICTRDAEDVRTKNPEVSEGIAAFLKKALCRDRNDRFASARDMLDVLVNESDGVLPTSLKSDSLKRAVVRSASNPAVKGAMTLAAVSTVAATPAASSGGSVAVAPPRRTILAVAGLSIALGGIVAGVWYANKSAPLETPVGAQPQVIVVQQAGETTTVFVTAPAVTATASEAAPSASAVESAVSASASESASTPASVSASASAAPRPNVPRPRPSAAKSAEPRPTGGPDLKLKPQ